MVMDESLREFPRTIDVNTTGACNLRCTFCWGAPHEMGSLIGTEGWRGILANFSNSGSEAVVFTGGEPLMRDDAVELIRHAKKAGMHTTLSTNGMFHEKLRQALPYLDEVGIPLDGSTPELNARMRTDSGAGIRHFAMAIEAMGIVKAIRPEVHLTARTVVSKVNYDDIEKVAALLVGLQSLPDRLKLYQFTPTGAYGPLSVDEHAISSELYQGKLEKMQSLFSEYFEIDCLASEQRGGRYIFIMPNGNVSGVADDGISYIHYGNAKDDFEGVRARFAAGVIAEANLTHGVLEAAL